MARPWRKWCLRKNDTQAYEQLGENGSLWRPITDMCMTWRKIGHSAGAPQRRPGTLRNYGRAWLLLRPL